MSPISVWGVENRAPILCWHFLFNIYQNSPARYLQLKRKLSLRETQAVFLIYKFYFWNE